MFEIKAIALGFKHYRLELIGANQEVLFTGFYKDFNKNEAILAFKQLLDQEARAGRFDKIGAQDDF